MRFVAAVLATVTFSFAAFAADDGFDAAEKVCAGMFVPSDTRACLLAVKDAKYFDVNAVGICKKIFIAGDQIKCLTTIKNQTYRATSLDICGKMFLPTDIVGCLKENGTPHQNQADVDVESVRTSVKRALRNVRAGEYRRAEAELEALLEELKN